MSFQLPKFFANRPPQTEAEHQLVVMTFCRTHPDDRLKFMFHIPNGGGRSKREASELKSIGVKSGVSDLFLPVMAIGNDGLVRGGLWIEMKCPGGRQSEEQIKWIYDMRRNGYEARIAFGWEEAVEIIREYIGEKGDVA